jgi:hypothetical protein
MDAPTTVFNTGKHNGKSFDEVLATDPSYYTFLSKWKADGKPMKKNNNDFLKYAKSINFEVPDMGETRLTKGKFAGKAFFDVVHHDEGGDYILWLQKRIADNEPTSRELRQLVEYAMS